MLVFAVVGILNGLLLSFLRYRAILPLPTSLLSEPVLGAAANAFAEELQFRSIVLGMLIFAGDPRRRGLGSSSCRRSSTGWPSGGCGTTATGISSPARCSLATPAAG